jgi:hypothetical protein
MGALIQGCSVRSTSKIPGPATGIQSGGRGNPGNRAPKLRPSPGSRRVEFDDTQLVSAAELVACFQNCWGKIPTPVSVTKVICVVSVIASQSFVFPLYFQRYQ